jgi:hypothetical protein
MQVLWFGFSLVAVGVLSVSVVPLLPSWLAPNLLALVIIGLAVDDRLASMNAWAIWGGVLLDLLSPSRFGLVWLPVVLVAFALTQLRRAIAVTDLPWLWPIWFGVGTLAAELPLAVVTHGWHRWSTSAVITAVWGTLILLGIRWVQSTKGSR